MLFNYFLLASRNIARQRGYALVNTFGLAIGLASALCIFMYVRDELSFDTQHPDAEHTYRLGWKAERPTGESNAFAATPAGWDNYIKSNFPGIDAIASYTADGMPTTLHYAPKDKKILTEDIIWAEPTLFDILDIQVLSGNRGAPLQALNSIMLSETAARELFGAEDPIDKTLTVSHTWTTNGQKLDLLVSAVYRDCPSNTHIHPKYICNILALKPVIEDLEHRLNTAMGDGERGFWSSSLFVCRDPAQLPAIQADLQQRANTIMARFDPTIKAMPVIRKITDVHFDQEIDWATNHKSANRKYISVFISIAVLILLVACINYINLATARSVTRAKEIGLRKTFGGVRRQLFVQFMIESFLMVLGAAVFALLLVALFLSPFNDMTGKDFGISHLFSGPMVLTTAGIVAAVTLLAGSYPALFVSGFQPAVVLKGKFAFRKGSTTFRQFLTTVQFTVAITLLVGSMVVVRQMNLMRHSKLNEAGKQILSIRYGGFSGPATDSKFAAFKNQVLQDPEIQTMTLANHLPRLDYFGPIDMRMQFPEISDERHEWFQLNGDFDFPKTFNMHILAGRDFDATRLSDSSAVLLNEAAVQALGLQPDEAVGKTIVRPALSMSFGPPDSTRAPVTGLVIGVVENFPYRSMHHKIAPLAIAPKPHTVDRIIHVRLPADKMGTKIAAIENIWKQTFPDFGFDYWFVDEEFGRMYENETQIAQLTRQFSALAMLITCVGLYGLAAFLSKQRTKEIGIRKTLGATNRQILLLLLWIFGKILIIGCLIGVPVALYLSGRWLKNFEYQTPLTFLLFAGAIGSIALITILTVGYESLKASMANPVKALQSE
ncbi:MAG: ABC transporter permease [Saprospiraceae bacterium]|nr:ABC transporter permease [Saprospiraceae bacterium]